MTDEQHPEGTPAPKTTITIMDLADVRAGDVVTVEFDGGVFLGPVRTGSIGDLVAGGWSIRKRDGMPVVGTRFISATREAPAWPTAPLVWWDGVPWYRDGDRYYCSSTVAVRYVEKGDAVPRTTTFAAEAVPVTVVPTAEWEALRQARERQRGTIHVVTDQVSNVLTAAAHLIDATDAMHAEATNE